MDKKRIGQGALIMMIFTSVFGFANGPVAFTQMGYASIIWYLIGGALFFLPTSLMYAEFGAALKESEGGIYSWMEAGIGARWAFVATFIVIASWIIWMINVSQKVWITISTLLFGSDTTETWSLFGMNGLQTVGVLAVIFVVIVAILVNRGVQSVAKISSVGGLFVMALNLILLFASIVILIGHHGVFQEPLKVSSFVQSSNPSFHKLSQAIQFALYGIFAYAGLEQMGGVMKDVDKAEKTYPKAVLISTVLIGVGYSLSIFLWGASSNWSALFHNKAVNLGNITYVMMSNLGYQLGNALGMGHGGEVLLGQIFTRFAGLSMFMAYTGAFFVLSYAPLKSFIMGSPKEVWPERMRRLNSHGVPSFTIWGQAIIVAILILAIAFGGNGATQLYQVLTNMSNVSSTLPYVFLIFAFPMFKRLNNVDRPFVFYKSKAATWIVTLLVEALVIVSIVLTIVAPFQIKDYFDGIWTAAGPIVFGAVALIMFEIGERRAGHKL
ncbi:APC family transporter [Weissella oryzae SG25]|uniref:APC family transporter n=1 Tax=Weissella oryzae (strain DSM 25784 / JCM 18191 / LMG 30913 / SG25) TaxID=1329250 RepID=A0A069CRJ6_WEIOS|nr:glutamate/gamma-aminobutyrate family transporter YjeM [Weissella oryzae]GAK30375.1 APC family transporter [Weissella oryzae SG25]